MFGDGRPHMGVVGVVDLEPGGPQRFHGRGEEPGVQGGDAVHGQGEAQGLGHLVHELAVADSAAVAKLTISVAL